MNVRGPKSPRQSQRRAGAAGNAVVNDGGDADHQIKVAMAAYFIAERRGFEPGHELEDWVAAEAEIAKTESPSVLKSIHPSPSRSAS
jgi:hypothetical protein